MARCILACTLLALFSPLVLAAPPKLTNLFPPGAQRGQSLTITASGTFSTWPVLVWADRPGITIVADKEKGKLNVQVAAEAIPGTYWLRLTDGEGASQLKPFIVGTLPEVAESETNDLPDKPQIVEPRVVINGKLAKNGDVDGYRVELKAGQTLVASLQANSILGSPMDAVLQICELVARNNGSGPSLPAEPFVVTENHDAVGLDPQLAFAAPHDGRYLVRVFAFPLMPDSSIRFSGGDDYIYRLTLTTGGFIDHALPLALPRDESHVLLGGWNLAGVQATVSDLTKADENLMPPDSPLAWVWSADAAGVFVLPRIDQPGLVASKASQPQELPVPATVSGRLEIPGEVDAFAFNAAKSQKLRIRVAAKALGFPTDPYVAIQSDDGKMLAEADDTGRDDRDPVLDFTPPSDGHYRVLVRDLARRGDVRMVYRLTIEPVQPDFSLSLAADSFVLEKDKPLEIPVTVAVRDGLREPIEIHVVGLPPGVVAEPVKFEPTGDSPISSSSSGRRGKKGGSSPAPSGPSVKLILKGDPAAFQPGGMPIRIEGRTAGSSPLDRTARFPLNLPFAGSHHAVWLTVRKP